MKATVPSIKNKQNKNTKLFYPDFNAVNITDDFWRGYINSICNITLPDVLTKFEQSGYLDNFKFVAEGKRDCHIGPPFSDGLVCETLRGAYDFLAVRPNAALSSRLDSWVRLIISACDADPDCYLCTNTTLSYPEHRWGENGGDLIIQHDLYNHGALIEAAISRYLATGQSDLLLRAVKAAKLIANSIGEPPRLNIVPGHSLPEEAFIRLYRLLRDNRETDDIVRENGIKPCEFLQVATFWYYARGRREGRTVSPSFSPEYNQDHLTFSEQKEAVGHAVRATLCYNGAAALAYESGNLMYIDALNSLWDNVANRKLHISGGIGTRHDIEGFDRDYNLPEDAYLETCAAIGFTFWNGSMGLLSPDGKYFDSFERSLYNNILASVGQDFTHYYYQNPLISEGAQRWSWHGCPCCPPMILKLFSSLQRYIFTYSEGYADVYVNMIISSVFTNGEMSVTLDGGKISVKGAKKPFALHIRVPEYADNFTLTLNGEPTELNISNGYAEIKRAWSDDDSLEIKFDTPPVEIAANEKAECYRGKVAIMRGQYLYCAEGIDNGGDVNFTLAENAELSAQSNGNITAKTSDGKIATLIPYYKWSNRDLTPMRVWLKKENFVQPDTGERLYVKYKNQV